MVSGGNTLDGINVLVTRPAHQSTFLSDGIRAVGGNPILFPVLEITEIQDRTALLDLINRLETFDLAIFVSPNAVNKGMRLITQQAALPSSLRFATVGKGSAEALHQFGVDRVIHPDERFDSEALLEMGALQQVAGKRVVIFRGVGGRPLLGDALRQRGAEVEFAECYCREKPNIDVAPLLESWSQGKINAVIITSSEGLRNLFDIIGQIGQQLLKLTPMFTTHERIARTARDLGLEHVVKTEKTGDEGLLLGLQDYFQVPDSI